MQLARARWIIRDAFGEDESCCLMDLFFPEYLNWAPPKHRSSSSFFRWGQSSQESADWREQPLRWGPVTTTSHIGFGEVLPPLASQRNQDSQCKSVCRLLFLNSSLHQQKQLKSKDVLFDSLPLPSNWKSPHSLKVRFCSSMRVADRRLLAIFKSGCLWPEPMALGWVQVY